MAASFGGTPAALNGATAVDLVAAPAGGKQRQVLGVAVDNLDTVSHTFQLRKNRSAGTTIVNYPQIVVETLQRGLFDFGSIVLESTDVLQIYMEGAHTTTAPKADPAFFETP